MDKETEAFLSQQILYRCPDCGSAIRIGIKDAGTTVRCKNCPFGIAISREVFLNSADDLAADIAEFLQTRSTYIQEP